MTFKSGKGVTVSVNGTPIPLIQVDVNENTQYQTFRNSLTGVYPVREATFSDVTGSVIFDLDFDSNPFASPIKIKSGNTVNLSVANGPDMPDLSKVIITSTGKSVVVDGKIGTKFFFVTGGTALT